MEASYMRALKKRLVRAGEEQLANDGELTYPRVMRRAIAKRKKRDARRSR